MVKNMYLNPYPTQKWLKVDYRSKYIRKNYKNSEKKRQEKILANIGQAQNCQIEHKNH